MNVQLDADISMAFAVHSSPGTFAVLIGSGVSRAASIPTGWDVVQDLVRKTATLQKATIEGDPISWYEGKYGERPNYSKVLGQVARTSAERRNLLRAYFEPTDEERADGLKVPTPAHLALADLVREGYIRVVLTTNFDRLIETALEGIGIVPQVIASADAALGALPLSQAPCTVIKVNSDYLDTRLRNTEGELAEYEPALSRLLDQVFDEYGLIVCGWSAEWDLALAGALERCSSRRFSTYWTIRGEVNEVAKRLQQQRRANVVRISDANAFLSALRDNVFTLRHLNRPHPLSVQAAVASTKRYLPDDASRIRLHDLVIGETELAWKSTNPDVLPLSDPVPTRETVEERVARYDVALERIQAIIAAGSYHGRTEQFDLWLASIRRLAMIFGPRSPNFYVVWTSLAGYPSLRLAYVCGIASVASNQFDNLERLLTMEIRDYSQRDRPFVVSDVFISRQFERKEIGLSLTKHFEATLRPIFSPYIPAVSDYLRAFRTFEVIASALVADLSGVSRQPAESMERHMYKGLIPLSHIQHDGATEIQRIEARLSEQGLSFGPIRAGLFGSDIERFRAALEFLKRLSEWGWGSWD